MGICRAVDPPARRGGGKRRVDMRAVMNCDGTLDRIHHALYVECREKAEREASPTACIIDSQSVKSAEKGGPALILTGSMRAN